MSLLLLPFTQSVPVPVPLWRYDVYLPRDSNCTVARSFAGSTEPAAILRDWAASYSVVTRGPHKVVEVSFDDQDGDAYINVHGPGGSCTLDLGINLMTDEPLVTTMAQSGLACGAAPPITVNGTAVIVESTVASFGKLDCTWDGVECKMPTVEVAAA